MNFITDISNGKFDGISHYQFQKFSKGEFFNRALLEVKKTKDKYTVKTSAEFGNGLVKDVAELLGDKSTAVTGAIVTVSNLDGEIEYVGKKAFQGNKRYLIDTEMTGTQILELLEKFPKAFFGLTFDAGETKLKIKPKAPKTGKGPGKNGIAPKADFCKLITTNHELGSGFIFETDNFKKAVINHKFVVERIVIPKELADCKDFALVREKALRSGKIIRNSIIDDKEDSKEIEFTA